MTRLDPIMWGLLMGLIIFSLYLVLVYLFVDSNSQFAFFFKCMITQFLRTQNARLLWSPGALSLETSVIRVITGTWRHKRDPENEETGGMKEHHNRKEPAPNSSFCHQFAMWLIIFWGTWENKLLIWVGKGHYGKTDRHLDWVPRNSSRER